MENIYVKCIEQVLKVEPPVEEARELIMRVVKQELQYSDKLTESQKRDAIELLSFMQFPLKIKREIFIQRLEVRHASLPAIGRYRNGRIAEQTIPPASLAFGDSRRRCFWLYL